ncbi:MAG: tyrosine--tRNA ligase [Planctomycetota bacterium]
MPTDVIADLEARGTLKDLTHPDLGAQLTAGEPWTVYCGFDPTSDSLHIGNLVSLMALRRFQLAGHKVIALVGGATGMIGDPSGRSEERNLLDEATLATNLVGLRNDIGRVLDLQGGDGIQPAMVLNNADWVRPLSVIDFLRDVGKHFRVNVMIKQDSVRDRLEREEGISFTEFSYMLIQSYDFLHLFTEHGCRLQIGGSDQWGNITAGTELIRRKLGEEAPQACGATLELLLDNAGVKFGKSTGGGALWMNPSRTSPYRLYQHLLNTADAGDNPADQEVARYLRVFTLLPVDEIAALMAEHNEARQQRAAQRRLAEEVVRMLHGDDGVTSAQQATEAIFGKADFASVPDAVLLGVFDDIDLRAEFERSRLADAGIPLIEAVAAAGLAKSKGEARKKLQEGAVTLNQQKVSDVNAALTADTTGGRGVCILGLGKQRRALVRFV